MELGEKAQQQYGMNYPMRMGTLEEVTDRSITMVFLQWLRTGRSISTTLADDVFCRKSTLIVVLSIGRMARQYVLGHDIGHSEQPRDGLATRRGNYREYLGQDTDHDRR